MEYRGIKLNIVILIMLIVLIVYFTGDYMINRYNVEKPLINEIKSLEGLEDVELTENNNLTKVKIKLNKNANLYNVYKDVENIALEKIGKGNFEIVLNNDKNNKLEDIYFQAHYAIFEGVATNQFTVMNKNITKIAENNNIVDYKLWVDSKYVYLKLADDENAYYHIIPRNGVIRGGENVG